MRNLKEISPDNVFILNSKHILNSDLQGIKVKIIGKCVQGYSVRPLDARLYKKYGVLNSYFNIKELSEV